MAFNTEKKTKKSTSLAYTAEQLMTLPEFKEDYQAFLYFQKNKKRVEQFEKILKAALMEEMEANGLLEIEKGNCHVKYVPMAQRRVVDTEALKEDGLYEDYLKVQNVSARVMITFVDKND